MHWSYRVMVGESIHPTVAIVEVFYEEDETIYGWSEPIELTAESLEDLKADMILIAQALNRPVLFESSLLETQNAALQS